jgi:cold shock CspA family protein
VRLGVVTEFDESVGLGTITEDDAHATFRFHVIEIADGSRHIEVGRHVAFLELARFGELQAGAIQKL